jgi:hypothetical protein
MKGLLTGHLFRNGRLVIWMQFEEYIARICVAVVIIGSATPHIRYFAGNTLKALVAMISDLAS